MQLCTDTQAASADLVSATLACPSCDCGPWTGVASEPSACTPGSDAGCGPGRRCRSCGAAHLLIPSWDVPRRADGAAVIARAVVLSTL